MVRLPEINRPPAEVVREAVPAEPQEEIKPDLPPKEMPEPEQEKPEAGDRSPR